MCACTVVVLLVFYDLYRLWELFLGLPIFYAIIKSFSVLSVWWLVDKWPNESVVESFTDSTK